MRLKVLVLVLSLAASLVASSRSPSAATPLLPPLAPKTTWSPNGPVHSIAVTDNTVYMGGNFTRFSPNDGNGISLSLQTQAPVPQITRVHGVVSVSIPDGAGGWYIGGTFRRVASVERLGLAHLRSDNTVDRTFDAGDMSGVKALALDGQTLYAGGSFTQAGGQPRSRIAALDAVSGVATEWNPSADADVLALAVAGSTVYAGGGFTSIGGQPRTRIAGLDTSTGEATAWSPTPNATVVTLLTAGSTLYAGGWFNRIDGEWRSGLAAFDLATGGLTPWSPNADNAVNALAVSGSTLYAGGLFGSIGGAGRRLVGAVDTQTGAATDWNASILGSAVNGVTVAGSTVYVTGNFRGVAGRFRKTLAALDTTTGASTGWAPPLAAFDDFSTDVGYTVSASGDNAFFGGFFSSIGSVARENLAAYDRRTGALKEWAPRPTRRLGSDGANPAGRGEVFDLEVLGSTVFVAGNFAGMTSVNHENLAAVDAETGVVKDWYPAPNGTVRAIAISGSTLYAGGDFSTMDGQPRSRLAAIDTETAAVLPWSPEPPMKIRRSPPFGCCDLGDIKTIVPFGSVILVGGEFAGIGGDSRHNLAQLDPVTGRALGFPKDVVTRVAICEEDKPCDRTSYVSALAVSGRTVYIGGKFNSIGGATRVNFGAADMSVGGAADFQADVDKPVRGIAASGSVVYPVGDYTTIGGQARTGLAAVDALTSEVLPWDPSPSGFIMPTFGFSEAGVTTAQVAGSSLFVGGAFTTISGINRAAFAEFEKVVDGEVQPNFNRDTNVDIVWRNSSTGEIGVWLMDGNLGITSGVALPTVGNEWRLFGTGDTDGDGDVDVFFHNADTGQVGLWTMDGTTLSSATLLTPGVEPDLNWRPEVVGDFNNDGDADIVWRNASTGEDRIWLMDGAVRLSDHPLPTNGDGEWTMVGAGDANDDGHTDLWWRRSSGDLAVWLFDGVTFQSGGYLTPSVMPDLSWTPQGIADLDNDGSPDILWRSSDGLVAAWLMDGTSISSASLLTPGLIPDANWNMVAPS